MPNILSLKDLPLYQKKVLMRVDFNVPQDKSGTITDDTRLRASLPSIKFVLEQGGCLVLMSHLGRPQDKAVPELSLKPIAVRLSELLGHPVMMAEDCIGPNVEAMVNGLKAGEVLLLENLRFHSGEETPSSEPAFVKNLAKLGDVYVNDAFGTAHRAHASTAEIAHFFPGKSAAGLLMEKEIAFLSAVIQNPKKPFIAVVGGAKISSKFGVLHSLLGKVEVLLVGGAMAYTFLKAQGYAVGNSLVEDDYLQKASQIIKEAAAHHVKLVLPIDHVAASTLNKPFKVTTVSTQDGIPDHWIGVDIGPETIKLFENYLKQAATVLWNGPLGVFEKPEFASGTQAIAKVVANLKATTIVGGGDSIAALQAAGVADQITHISTGGGATLEYIEFSTLPGIEALKANSTAQD